MSGIPRQFGPVASVIIILVGGPIVYGLIMLLIFFVASLTPKSEPKQPAVNIEETLALVEKRRKAAMAKWNDLDRSNVFKSSGDKIAPGVELSLVYPDSWKMQKNSDKDILIALRHDDGHEIALHLTDRREDEVDMPSAEVSRRTLINMLLEMKKKREATAEDILPATICNIPGYKARITFCLQYLNYVKNSTENSRVYATTHVKATIYVISTKEKVIMILACLGHQGSVPLPERVEEANAFYEQFVARMKFEAS